VTKERLVENATARKQQSSMDLGYIWTNSDEREARIRELLQALPHGSGFDSEFHADDCGDIVVVHQQYHAMSELGFYLGYFDFELVYKDAGNSFQLQQVRLSEEILRSKDTWAYDFEDYIWQSMPREVQC
jgi:hypothetical protein